MRSQKDIITLKPPLEENDVKELRAGDIVEVSGTIVTARDKAYMRILDLLEKDQKLPVELKDSIIYHCGPLVRRVNEDWEIVAAGPTTSARLDDVQSRFVEMTGVRGLIGKGGIGEKISREVGRKGCIYLAYTGGAAALAADSIESVENVFWLDLGTPEALWVLNVEGFGPMSVAVDTKGGNLYTDK